MIPKSEWEWFGYPGHFICSDRCRFRLCTKVGDYLISTVGDLHYEERGKRQTLGAGEDSFFETYVFKAGERCKLKECGCNQPSLDPALEIDGERTQTAGAAQKAHMRYCNKYARKRATDSSSEGQ